MEPLRIIPLGGLGEFGLNMMLLVRGCGHRHRLRPHVSRRGLLESIWLFPTWSYLLEKDSLKGIVLSHAHEDHVGALPYILVVFLFRYLVLVSPWGC